MNYWQEKNEFWRNKTKDNEVYINAREEIGRDIAQLHELYNFEEIIDFGGYHGELREYLPAGINYVNLDFETGIDFSQDIKEQLIKNKIELKGDRARTLALTSLTLITLPPDVVDAVLKEMHNFAKVRYFYEENTHIEYENGQKLNDNYGGKWNYVWGQVVKPNYFLQSHINPAWVRMICLPKKGVEKQEIPLT